MKIKIELKDLEDRGNRELYRGETVDSSEGFNINNTGKNIKYVVMKGYIDDWCVYAESCWEDMSFEKVISNGDKILPDTARNIIEADDEVWKRYRN